MVNSLKLFLGCHGDQCLATFVQCLMTSTFISYNAATGDGIANSLKLILGYHGDQCWAAFVQCLITSTFTSSNAATGDGIANSLKLILGYHGDQCLAGSFKTDRPVAYAPQQPWISNSTIRSNILFGSEYDELRYNATVTACALDHDISHFPAGHYTEIVSFSSSLTFVVTYLMARLLVKSQH